MNAMKLNYEMKKFDEENVECLLKELGLDQNNYFIAMTKPSILNTMIIGYIAEFSNRCCIISFSTEELNLIMLSRISNKKVTELIKVDRNEINNMKLSNILISYMLNISTNDSKMKFQVYKKVGRFTKIKNSIEVFKKLYCM